MRPENVWSRLRPQSDAMLRLDALRFIASAAIVWHHSSEFLLPAGRRADWTAQTLGLALFVDMFFAISGFVIAYVYADRMRDVRGYADFMRRRVGRLVPLHWLTLALSWLLWVAAARLASGINHPPELGLTCVAHVAFLLHGIIPCGTGGVLNGVSWSISAEMALYLLFPLLALTLRSRSAPWIAMVAAFSLPLWLLGDPRGDWTTLHPVIRALPSFLFGMILCRERARLATYASRGTTPLMLAGLAVTLVMMMTGVPQLLTLCAIYVVVILAVSGDARVPAGRRLAQLSALGQLTYSIYMWHSLLILVGLNILGDKLLHLSPVPMAALMTVTYAAILILGYLSWVYVETPARRWIDGSGRRRAARDGAPMIPAP